MSLLTRHAPTPHELRQVPDLAFRLLAATWPHELRREFRRERAQALCVLRAARRADYWETGEPAADHGWLTDTLQEIKAELDGRHENPGRAPRGRRWVAVAEVSR